jgi:mono/diheme cytochrome c family protein
MSGKARCARLVVMMALLAGCGAKHVAKRAIAPSPADLVAEGRRAYLESCASCHGRSGVGDGSIAASLRTAPTDLTRLSEQNGGTFPRDRFIAIVTGARDVAAHGTREMPVWGIRFEPPDQGATAVASVVATRRIESLLAYVETLQRTSTARP